MPSQPIGWWIALITALLKLVAEFFDDDCPPPTQPTRASAGRTGEPPQPPLTPL